uniref:Uncharacterized protein n=1 Tax=mine drainage metagenome TaxID=410659 RepID=E6PZY5_9ZZZZ
MNHRFRRIGYAVALLLILASPTQKLPAASCTTQGMLTATDREALLAVANPLAEAIATQNTAAVKAALLPAISNDWETIQSVVLRSKPLFEGGQLHWRTMYLLDASDQKTAADTEFFCTNSDSTLTVTVNLHSLPPGRYALMIGDYLNTPLAGQLAFILADDHGWKLGGLYAREGALDGRDGVAFWKQARADAKSTDNWSAWFSYDAARWLLLPVEFLASPNLEKLDSEQQQVSSPMNSLPLVLSGAGADAGKSWKLTAVRLDTTLHSADLALTYDGSGITDPVAARAEAVAVMSALLRVHPELRQSFHGLWAYAEKDGRQTFAIEQPMKSIP